MDELPVKMVVFESGGIRLSESTKDRMSLSNGQPEPCALTIKVLNVNTSLNANKAINFCMLIYFLNGCSLAHAILVDGLDRKIKGDVFVECFQPVLIGVVHHDTIVKFIWCRSNKNVVGIGIVNRFPFQPGRTLIFFGTQDDKILDL